MSDVTFGIVPVVPNITHYCELSIVSKEMLSPRPVSPVWQFVCLLAPIVMTGFYLVYALVGLIIDGSDKIKWSDEALQVGLLVTMIIVVINVVVMLYALFHRLRFSHLLWVSPIVHIAIALALTALIATILT